MANRAASYKRNRLRYELLEQRRLLAVADAFEPDNIASQATDISALQSPQVHSIHVESDVDWTKFTVAEDSLVTLETTGQSGDTRMWLYGPNSAEDLYEYDDDGGAGAFSKIVEALEPGAYYVKVDEYSNNDTIDQYALNFQMRALADLEDDHEPDNVRSQATVIATNGQTQSHSLHYGDDVDWYSFTLDDSAMVVAETDGPSGATVLRLYDQYGSQITYNYSGGNGSFSRIQRALEAGNYFLRVEESGRNAIIESYTIGVTASPLPDLSVGNATINATGDLRPGQELVVTWAASNFGGSDATSRYDRIYLSQDNRLGREDTSLGYEYVGETLSPNQSAVESRTVDLPASGDWLGRDAYLLVEADEDDDVPESNESNNVFAIPVSFASHQDLQDNYEPDNGLADATTLTANGETQTHNLHHGDDEDWFTFTVTEPSLVNVETDGPSGSTYMRLFDQDGTRIAYDYSSGNGYFSHIQQDVPAGTYFVSVEESGRNDVIDSYSINLATAPLPDLTVSSPRIDAIGDLLPDQEITVTWTVNNLGLGASFPRYDQLYLSEDDQLGNDYSLGYTRIDEALAANQSAETSRTVDLPDYAYWLGRDAYLLIEVDEDHDVPETNEDNNVIALPVSFASHIEITSPSYSPRVNPGTVFDIGWRAVDGGNASAVRLAIDSDSDPENGVGHVWLDTDDPLTASVLDYRYDRMPDPRLTTVSLASITPRSQPYYIWAQMDGSDGVVYSSTAEIHVVSSPASFIEDSLDDAVGGNGYEVFGVDAYQQDASLHFRVRTNYNPGKSSYTGNGSGGGDIRFVIGETQYGLAVNNHQAGDQPVVAGRLYVGADFLPGTTVEEVPSFIDSYEGSLEGITTITTAEIEDHPWQYEIEGSIDLSQLPDYDYDESVEISWAMYCGNDTAIVDIQPDDPDETDDSLDLVASRLQRYEDDEGGGVELFYEVVSDQLEGQTQVPIAIHWATGSAAGDHVGESIFTQVVAASTGENTLRIAASDFADRPPEADRAWHLHAVIDVEQQVEETNEDNNLAVLEPEDAQHSHELYEYLAREIIYRDGTIRSNLSEHVGQFLSQVPQQSGAVSVDGWRVENVWAGSSGFYAAAFTSENIDPILVFRGTDFDSPLDWLSNSSVQGVGYSQYQAHRSEILQWVGGFTNVSFVGHSLGGALAQWFAADVTAGGNDIGEVVTFNSPGIAANHAQTFRRQLSDGATHYIVNGDIVSMAGHLFLQGEFQRFNYDQPLTSAIVGWHVKPLLIPYRYDTSGMIENRPSFTAVEPLQSTGWLNSPYYFHTNPKYLLMLTGLNAVTQTVGGLGGAEVVPLILFRQTMEESRQLIGNFVKQYLSFATFSTDPSAISVGVPKIEFSIGSLLDAKVEDLRVIYNADSAALRMQGKVELSGLYGDTKLIADFAGQNFLQYSPTVTEPGAVDPNDGWEAVGKISLADLVIVPEKWVLKEGFIEFDTLQNEIAGGGKMLIPGDVTVEAKVGFQNGELSQIMLGAEGLNVPVFATGAFLRSISGDLQHIGPTDPAPTVFTGESRLTYGPEKTLTFPSWFTGATITASLASFDLQSSWNRDRVTGDAEVNVLFGLASGNAGAELNWTEGFVSASGQFDVLGGLASGNGSFRADSDWNLAMAANAAVRLPVIPYTPINGQVLQQGQFRIQYVNDGISSNDYVALWGKFNFFGERSLGIKYSLDNDLDIIGDISELPVVDPNDSSTNGSGGTPAQGLALSRRAEPEPTNPTARQAAYDVAAGSETLLLYIGWEDDRDLSYEIVDPSGVVYQASEVEHDESMSEIDAMQNTRSRAIGISSPMPGRWTIRDASGTAQDVRFQAYGDVQAAEVTITDVSVGDATSVVTFTSNADTDAAIYFYASSDQTTDDGGIYLGTASPGQGATEFEFGNDLPSGQYVVQAILDDGRALPEASVSESFTISPQPFGSIGGHVFADMNQNGLRDPNEPGISNVAVTLTGDVTRTTWTDDHGEYLFEQIPPGEYSVTQSQPLAYLDGADALGDPLNGSVGDDALLGITLGAGQALRGYNFSEWALNNGFGAIDSLEMGQTIDGLTVPPSSDTSPVAVPFVASQSGVVTLSTNELVNVQLIDSDFRLMRVTQGSSVEMTLQAGGQYALLFDGHTAPLELQLDNTPAGMQVTTSSGPFHNHLVPSDVNNDGDTTARDALSIINRLRTGARFGEWLFLDVNRDDRVTALDALIAINRISRVPSAEAEIRLPQARPANLSLHAVDAAVNEREVSTIPAVPVRSEPSEPRARNVLRPSAREQVFAELDDAAPLDDVLSGIDHSDVGASPVQSTRRR